ncbi:ATP-dependent zinc metalloprotease FtsH [Mycoplasmoides alvi]|uniref:ATP-dependent zinc metalloprotease FtsH n=1 Tax=Mycoplasmoides alvi TaxID=78580 RepID=UPI000A031297|nr:ATP-dependent zinc metalloprotease FtsH [Mycoplasmoides alvi]
MNENRMDPAKRRSLIVNIIVWTIILGIIIAIIVVVSLPQTSVISITFSVGADGKLYALLPGRLDQLLVNPNSSFSTSLISDTKFWTQINIDQVGNVLVQGQYNPADGTWQIGNLIINKGAGSGTFGLKETDGTISDITQSLVGYRDALLRVGNIQPTNTAAQTTLNILISLLPVIIMIIIFSFFFRALRKGVGGLGGEGEGESVFTIGRSQAKLAKSGVRFSDVAGIEEEKNELIEIVDYLKYPERYAQMGARVPRGVILYGPPGTGKTLLAKAVAGEAEVPFFQVTGSAFEDMLVGVGAKRVKDLFAKARKAAPCIIFIDEIDSVGSKRGRFEVSNYSLAEQTLNQLLAEMDGFNNRTGIVVMAATNRLDVLDDALLRPGRFDRHIQVNLPDVKEREAILKIHASNKNLSAKVNLKDIAKRTPGFSGAQLENVLNEATLLAVRAKRNAITTGDLDEAIDRVMAGPAKKSRVMTEFDKKLTAYHEAGHALVGLHLEGADEVQKITIIPRGQAGGYTLSTPKDAEMLMKRKSDLLHMVASALGGRAAEELIFGSNSITTGASNDFYKATNIVKTMVTQLGMSRLGMVQYVPSEGVVNPNARLYSDKTAEEIDKVIAEIISEQYEVAKKILQDNREEHELIVQALLLQETILKKDIDYIHKEHKLPPEALAIQKQNEEASKKKHEEVADKEPNDASKKIVEPKNNGNTLSESNKPKQPN